MSQSPANSIWLEAGQAPPAGSPAGRLWTWLQAQVDAALYRPCAAPGVVARRLHEDGVTYYVLKNPAQDAYLKLSESDHTVWTWMDGSRTVKDLVIAYFEQFQTLALGRITSLVDELKAAGFLTDRPANVFRQVAEQLARRNWTYRWKQMAGALTQREFALDGLDRWITALYQKGGWLLFTPVAQVLFIGVALAGLIAFALTLTDNRYSIVATGGSYWLGLGLLWAINLAVITVHEHAHALTTKHMGREVRRGGFMIYYLMPAFFVDTMDIWLEPKPRRIAVTWAGPYSGLIVGGLCSLVALALPAGLAGHLAFKTAFVCYAGALVNLNPLLELDGYFMLMDWLGIPNLRERSFAFIRTELGPKLKQAFASATALPGPRPEPPPIFDREETIFAGFGLLAAAYTLYTAIVAAYFWQTRFWSLLVELWSQPDWPSRLAAVIFGAGVIVPVSLIAGVVVWSAGRGLYAYLDKRHFFESQRNVVLLLVGAWALVTLAPLVTYGRAWAAYTALAPAALAGLAAAVLVRAARQHTGSRFQYTFWALALSAALLTLAAVLRAPWRLAGQPAVQELALVSTVLEQLAAWPLLVVAFQSLMQVDVRHSTVWERLAIMAILASSFVVITPAAAWLAGQPWPVLVLGVAGPWFTLIFLATIIPTLATYSHTRFGAPWLILTTGVALSGALSLARLAPAWASMGEAGLWLEIPAAGLWAAGSLAYVMAGLRLHPETAHWSEDLLLSDNERLRLAFARFFETLFAIFRAVHGARRAKAVDDDLDVIGVAADWDVEIDSGCVNDELDLAKISILEQADRYRDVLARAIDLMDDWAGAAFIARATQAAYDNLPWPERETLGQYVLAGSPWGSAIAGRFDAVRGERYRLLQQVPLLSGCDNRALALIMAAVKSESAPAGTVLGRQGAPVTRFVIVQSGAVEKWVQAGESPAQLAGVLRRGASLGSEAFVGGGAYTGTYRTSVATDLLYLPLEECRRLVRAGVKLGAQVGQALAIRQLLGRMPLFAGLGPQQLDVLVRKMGHQQFEAGAVIVRQGETRHHFYIIASGQVEISVLSPDGQTRVVANLGPGQHFGETALYADVPYSATCRAVAPSELLTMDEAMFDAMVGGSLQMSHYIEQVSSGRMIDTRRKLGLAGIGPA